MTRSCGADPVRTHAGPFGLHGPARVTQFGRVSKTGPRHAADGFATRTSVDERDVTVAVRDQDAVDFRFDDALPILRRTPAVLRELLLDLPASWTGATEGPGTWSPFDVVGHLIQGEEADWVPRIEHLLRHGVGVAFTPFDREAMFEVSNGRSLEELLETFAVLRSQSLSRLAGLRLTDADLTRRGRHPEFGTVTLGQHLATWVAHDLGHIRQIVRVMARQYTEAVGPWRAYLPVLGSG
jgi:DinB superfamily